MGMTIAEKIIAAHAGRPRVEPGEIVVCKVDLVMAHDMTGPIAIREFERIGATDVFNRDAVVLIPDHFTPNKDIASAENCMVLREFARKHRLSNYFELGRAGICHAFLPEQGLVLPGMIIAGADSHTCTYGALGAMGLGMGSTDVAGIMALGETWLRVPETLRVVYHGQLRGFVSSKDVILRTVGDIGVDGGQYMSLEFTGEGIAHMSMDARFTMCNMAAEVGAKCAIMEVDDVTRAYLKARTRAPYTAYCADEDAEYSRLMEYDLSSIDYQVALPFSPGNVKNLAELCEDVAVDQCVIGSCTNGRIEDLAIAASILKGKKVCPGTRLIVIPATQRIYREAMAQGLLDTFLAAGGVVAPPTCGPCIGGHMGILGPGEVAVSTTNRNFVSRMGHPSSKVYLASPAVVAASAVAGRIARPEEVL